MDDATLNESSGIYLENGFYAQETNINGTYCNLFPRTEDLLLFLYTSKKQLKQIL